MSDRGPAITLRPAEPADAPAIAEVWFACWEDGHLGLVPQALVDVRTAASFRGRAPQRIDDTTVALVDGAVAGFVMVVGDEVEQLQVPVGVPLRRSVSPWWPGSSGGGCGSLSRRRPERRRRYYPTAPSSTRPMCRSTRSRPGRSERSVEST